MLFPELEKSLTREVAKNIDIQKLAKKIAPRIQKDLEKNIIAAAIQIEFTDLLWDKLDTKEIMRVLSNKIVVSMGGVPIPPKQMKRKQRWTQLSL